MTAKLEDHAELVMSMYLAGDRQTKILTRITELGVKTSKQNLSKWIARRLARIQARAVLVGGQLPPAGANAIEEIAPNGQRSVGSDTVVKTPAVAKQQQPAAPARPAGVVPNYGSRPANQKAGAIEQLAVEEVKGNQDQAALATLNTLLGN